MARPERPHAGSSRVTPIESIVTDPKKNPSLGKQPQPRNPEVREKPWTDLCDFESLPQGQGKYLALRNHTLAIFRTRDDRVLVMDDTCPHAGGSLSAGHVENDCTVYCPWHHWPFQLQDGCCSDNLLYKVRTYPARVTNGRVEAKLPRSK
jgi:nitrite reductase (NADH) small subunit